MKLTTRAIGQPCSSMEEIEVQGLGVSADALTVKNMRFSAKFGAPGRTRTDTGRILSPLSLPLDYGGHEQVLRKFT